MNYYKSKIDALYGRGTEKALIGYANAKGINISNTGRVFKSVLSQVSVPSSFETAASIKTCSPDTPEGCPDEIICAVVRTMVGTNSLKGYVKEARKRGLSCG